MEKIKQLFMNVSKGDAECEKREELLQKRAEIARCWIKYCLNLLQDAKKLLEVAMLFSFTFQELCTQIDLTDLSERFPLLHRIISEN